MNRRGALAHLAALALAGEARAALTAPPPSPELWLSLNTAEQRLEAFVGEQPVLHYNNISWGRGGVGLKRRQGDAITPIGSFCIRWVNRSSRFRTFLGFDYPSVDYAQRALQNGTIDGREFGRIIDALAAAEIPPQGTAIGGSLGIHGLGRADPGIHRAMNWTGGCIALNNTQIDHLARLVEIGTRVVIRA